MIRFDSFMHSVGPDRVVFFTEVTVVFDSALQEHYSPGYPSLWDEYLLSKIVIDDYDVCSFFAHIIPKNERSRITDYKKVWGLSEITKGTVDLSYETDSQAVYLGMTRTCGEEGFKNNCSSLILLIPKEMRYDSSSILESFAQHRCNFSDREISNVLSEMCKQIPNTIGLWYSIKESATLTIFRNEISKLFTNQDFSVIKKVQGNVSPAYKMPFCNLFI